MRSDVETGQVIALRIRFNNNGDLSPSKHPYLVVDVDTELNVVEIAQLDSLRGKEWKAFRKSKKVIYCTEPDEKVIDRDSYIQLDNTIRVEDFPELTRFRRQKEKLSADKLDDALRAYREYHKAHEIDEVKNVYMDKAEVLALNL